MLNDIEDANDNDDLNNTVSNEWIKVIVHVKRYE
jgi:hypothetical protein